MTDGWSLSFTHADGDAEVVSVSRQSSPDAECGKGGVGVKENRVRR